MTARLPPSEIPHYLAETYWWAYVHPRGVRFFERQWLVNLILWGNFARLRDAALQALGPCLSGRTLQVACVYGDLTPRLAARVAQDAGTLDVVDVVPMQLENLRAKLPARAPATLLHGDASALPLGDATYDRALLFFLLHEVPCEVRRAALAEALRVLKPGAPLVVVDYHRPRPWHPLRGVMRWILRRFEPFAADLWRRPLVDWLPLGTTVVRQETLWGDLYQLLVVARPE